MTTVVCSICQKYPRFTLLEAVEISRDKALAVFAPRAYSRIDAKTTIGFDS